MIEKLVGEAVACCSVPEEYKANPEILGLYSATKELVDDPF